MPAGEGPCYIQDTNALIMDEHMCITGRVCCDRCIYLFLESLSFLAFRGDIDVAYDLVLAVLHLSLTAAGAQSSAEQLYHILLW